MPTDRPWYVLFAALLLSSAAASAQAPDAQRGEALYLNHCTACHESLVHIRDTPKVRSAAALRAQVTRWAEEIGRLWGAEEIEDVVAYLNAAYYRFPP